jgi:hypothetical protein
MFTKLFRSIVTSSIWAEDADTRVIWVTMLALADFEGIVEASAPGLAQTAGISLEKTQYALKKFMEPDEHSRSQEHEGRRIKRVDGGYKLLNFEKYRDLRGKRKEYMRYKKREQRARERQKGDCPPSVPPENVNTCQHLSTHKEEEEEKEEYILKKKVPKKRFIPPTLEEVKLYVMAELLNVDPIEFWKGYSDGGWIDVHGKPVRNWKLKCRSWHNRHPKTKQQAMIERVMQDD